MFKRILVPLDGSKFAESVLPQAEMLAKCGDGQITLLRVAVHPSTFVYVPDPAALADLYDSDRTHCQNYLQDIVGQVEAQSGLHATTVVLEGPVADAILDYATESGADLIVMSTHGRTGMERWLLGSMAEKVVRGAHMPVMLIRPPAREQAEVPAKKLDVATPAAMIV